MPTRLAAPVLTVNAGKMHKVDTRNVENLFGMWTGEAHFNLMACYCQLTLPFSQQSSLDAQNLWKRAEG